MSFRDRLQKDLKNNAVKHVYRYSKRHGLYVDLKATVLSKVTGKARININRTGPITHTIILIQ